MIKILMHFWSIKEKHDIRNLDIAELFVWKLCRRTVENETAELPQSHCNLRCSWTFVRKLQTGCSIL